MAQITYTDKVALNVNSDIADINKVNAADMNEIKASVNNNDDMLNGNAVAGNMVVEGIRTKNMFDSSTLAQGDVAGSTSAARVSTRQTLYLSAGTYTFSTNMPNTYRFGILIRPSAPPTSTTSSYDSGWQTSASFTFTISTSGYFMMNFSKADNTNLTPSDIKAYDFQLEKGSTATAYTPYQNLSSQPTTTTGAMTYNSTYLAPVYNQISRSGNVVQIYFLAKISTAWTGNTDLLTSLPRNAMGINYRFVGYIQDDQYLPSATSTRTMLWTQTDGTSIRCATSGIATNKYICIELTYITNE
jgi:hypothetical protein